MMREKLIGEPQTESIGRSGVNIQIPDIYTKEFMDVFVKFSEKRIQKHLFEPSSSIVRRHVEEDILSSYLSAALEFAKGEILRK